MTVGIVFLLVAAMALTCSRPAPETTVRRFLAASDSHDVEATLGLLDEDFEFRDRAGTFRVTRDRFRPLLEWDAAVDRRSSATVTAVRGDTVSVSYDETNDFLEMLRIGPVRSQVDIVTRDGSIRAIVLHSDSAFFSRFQTALAPVLKWAGRERPAVLERLLENGSIAYDGERGRLWLELLREAAAAGVIDAGPR